MSGVHIDGALELAAAWDAAEARADDELKPVVSKGALNVKKATQATWAGHRHAPALAAAVSYDDPRVEGEAIVTEIGPDKDRRQGALGNIYEYGTPNNAPRPALNPALDAEAPKFEAAAGDAAEKLADV